MAGVKRVYVTPEEHVELLKSEIDDLHREVDTLSEKYADATTQIQDMKAEISQLQQTCAGLRNVIEFRDETIQKMKLEMEDNYVKVFNDSDADAEDDEEEEDDEDEDEDEEAQ